MKKFDLIKLVLPLKFMSLGCTMVTLRAETLLYMSTPQYHVLLCHAVSCPVMLCRVMSCEVMPCYVSSRHTRTDHHTPHFKAGFIRDPMGHWNASANSLLLERVPITLRWRERIPILAIRYSYSICLTVTPLFFM